MVKVLLAVTSANPVFYADGKRTGIFVVEALHPFEVFRKKGYEVQFASETGTYGYDEHSTGDDFLNGEDRKIWEDPKSEYNVALKNIKKASDLNPNDYDIFFASAGHGTLFDYPKAKNLQDIAATTYDKGGVVSAVCHGPAIFENLIDPKTKEPLIKGKKITGFTDVGEDILGVMDIMKKDHLLTIKEIAEKEGATYIEPEGPWANFAIADGKIVTGVNPQSAVRTAELAIDAFEG
ncbi:GLX3 Glyoxalase 3 [Candida maltosa Xu316]|uniref:D-lactate dehydratase n=1 Tax=Candida maltosa (strain Xu316) TaxID=1245528 RepID=M3JW52_CANMX|nr:Protein SNO4 [Candida maltosa Xu316]